MFDEKSNGNCGLMQDDILIPALRSQLAASEKSLAESKGLLKELEYSGMNNMEERYCEICGGMSTEPYTGGKGHKPDCRLAAMIAEPKP